MGDLFIRRAEVADASRIAEMHVAGWRETYASMMPADFLAALDETERAARWRDTLRAGEQGADDAVFLVGRAGEPPSGFAACARQGAERLARAGFAGEFSAVYVLAPLQRRGAGRRLIGAMAAHLLARGISSAGVWVLRERLPARRFYEALGAKETGIEGVWSIPSVDFPDLAYGWRDLAPLAAESRSYDHEMSILRGGGTGA